MNASGVRRWNGRATASAISVSGVRTSKLGGERTFPTVTASPPMRGRASATSIVPARETARIGAVLTDLIGRASISRGRVNLERVNRMRVSLGPSARKPTGDSPLISGGELTRALDARRVRPTADSSFLSARNEASRNGSNAAFPIEAGADARPFPNLDKVCADREVLTVGQVSIVDAVMIADKDPAPVGFRRIVPRKIGGAAPPSAVGVAALRPVVVALPPGTVEAADRRRATGEGEAEAARAVADVADRPQSNP